MKTFFHVFQDHLRCLMGSKQRYFLFRGLTIGCFQMIRALLEQKYFENFDELVKTSLFTWDTLGKGLPGDLGLVQLEAHVSADYSDQAQFSINLYQK